MAAPSKYNLDTFRKLVVGEKTKTEIMGSLKIKNSAQIDRLLLKLIMTDDKVYHIKGGLVGGKNISTGFKVSKKGSLTLPSSFLETGGFQPNDCFTPKIVGSKITLTKIEMMEQKV